MLKREQLVITGFGVRFPAVERSARPLRVFPPLAGLCAAGRGALACADSLTEVIPQLAVWRVTSVI